MSDALIQAHAKRYADSLGSVFTAVTQSANDGARWPRLGIGAVDDEAAGAVRRRDGRAAGAVALAVAPSDCVTRPLSGGVGKR